jgi:hypothetical protein
MITGTGEIGIRKSDPTMRTVTKDVTRRWLPIEAKEESRLRIHVGVPPAIENDSGDVSARIEAAGREHVGHLLAECPYTPCSAIESPGCANNTFIVSTVGESGSIVRGSLPTSAILRTER